MSTIGFDRFSHFLFPRFNRLKKNLQSREPFPDSKKIENDGLLRVLM
jgi:hypothetical protein